MSLLAGIQREIEGIYALPPAETVDRYLIGPRTFSAFLPEKNAWRTHEALLVDQEGEECRIGLYIAPEIVTFLKKNRPWERLTSRNLEPFCTAIEGVSHFLFVIARMMRERPVSQLELELQAEIDKFLVCSLALERQHEGLARRQLPYALFDRYRLITPLTADEEERYHLANRLAFQYCRRLQKISHPLERPRLVCEARRFREQGLEGKIQLLTNRR